MPWRQSSAMDERIRFLVRAEQPAQPLEQLCQEFGVHRTTGWRWRKRLEETGRIDQLAERSRKPAHSPRRIAFEIEERIVELRRERGWGGLKLKLLLEREGVAISVATVNRVLKRRELISPADSHPPAGRRFERDAPNQLWQMDFKGIRDHLAVRYGSVYPLSILDDHSRFLVGLFPLAQPDGGSAMHSLRAVFEAYGLPEAMLMDHGAPWWSPSNGHGLTRLTVALMKQGIQLLFSAVGHPQTQGKVERLHRTMQHSIDHRARSFPGWQDWAEQFRQEYNYVRPHQALAMAVPAERYHPSPRAWQEHPPGWDYELNCKVERLNSKGCVTHRGRRWFVCEALAGEEVALEPWRDALLVRYRTTYVRQLDLQTGSTRPLLTHRLGGPPLRAG